MIQEIERLHFLNMTMMAIKFYNQDDKCNFMSQNNNDENYTLFDVKSINGQENAIYYVIRKKDYQNFYDSLESVSWL